MKPSQPANSSCPGLPCLTLAQYINNTDLYFKASNNSLFWFLSGTHYTSLPVVITDSHNVTFRNYVRHEGDQYPTVIFNPGYICQCEKPVVICTKCSAIQFSNTSDATVKGIELIAIKHSFVSSANGVAFLNCDTITVESFSVSIVFGKNGTVADFCWYKESYGYTVGVCGGVLLQETTTALLTNLTLNNVLFYALHSHAILARSLIIRSAPRRGVKAEHVSNMIMEDIEILGAKSHCIRLDHTQNLSVTDSRLSNCGDNGIELIAAADTSVNYVYFDKMSSKALNLLSQSRNTTVRNSIIRQCSFFCVNMNSVFDTYFENVTASECSGFWGMNLQRTTFHNLSITSGMMLINSSHSLIKDSTVTILDNTINGLSMENSNNTLLLNVTVGSSIAMQNSKNTMFESVRIRNVTNKPALLLYESVNTTIQEMSFNNFSSAVGDTADYPAVVLLYESRDVYLNNCTFSWNTLTALKAFGSNIVVGGSVVFANNTAALGAAVVLHEKSVMKLTQNSSLLFTGNYATSVGGAIYVDTNRLYQSTGSGEVEVFSVCMVEVGEDSRLQFCNNSAGSGGDVVYGGYMGLATTDSGSNCLLNFKQVSVMNQTNTMSIISSHPSRVCVCNSTGHLDCLAIFQTHTLYPGERISLSAVVVGQDFGTGAGSVYGQFLDTETETRLEQWQYSQEVSQKYCNQLSYSILAAPTDSAVLVLTAIEMTRIQQVISNDTVKSAIENYNNFRSGYGLFPQELLSFPVYINISVLPCPLGFSLSESPYKCECSPELSQLPGVECHIENQTFERSGSSWVGLIDGEELAVSQYCLPFFCKQSSQNVTLDDWDQQCDHDHSGVLCSGCKSGLSAVLGSHRCLRCSNKNLSLFLVFALAGVVLVFAIKALDITVSSGYINGLVLYFNIIQSDSILVPRGHNNPFTVVVDWLNLDLGIETCLFDGLTPYWMMWLQFLFPLYIWTISGAIILLARHSMRLAKLMGSNPVSVLATLFLLSYAKLMHICVLVISYSLIVYPHGTKMVWYFDGNMKYLGPEHLPLFVVAVAVLVFLCVPYTLILLLGQWLYRCENRFISRAMFRVKPFMDAYHGPLKDRHRYWLGFLLFSWAVIHIILYLVPNPSNRVVLLGISLLSICLLLLNVYAKGFYQNWHVSVFEATIVSNLALHSTARLYLVQQTHSEAEVLMDNLFTAAGITQLSLLLLYHLFLLFKQRLSCRFRAPQRRWSGRQGGDGEEEENWETCEEASLMRNQSEAREISDDERVPIAINSLPTYGT